MNKVIYTNIDMELEIRNIKELEKEIKRLTDLKKAKENNIKATMEQAGVETLEIAGFVVRYTKFLKSQLDSALLKKLGLYSKYLKQIESTKFSISWGVYPLTFYKD